MSALLRRATVAGPEQGVDFGLRGQPILDLAPGHESTPLGAQIRRLRDHRAAHVLRNGDARGSYGLG